MENKNDQRDPFARRKFPTDPIIFIYFYGYAMITRV